MLIYTYVIIIYFHLQIINILNNIQSDSHYFMIRYNSSPQTVITKTSNTGNIDWENLWVVSTNGMSGFTSNMLLS